MERMIDIFEQIVKTIPSVALDSLPDGALIIKNAESYNSAKFRHARGPRDHLQMLLKEPP